MTQIHERTVSNQLPNPWGWHCRAVRCFWRGMIFTLYREAQSWICEYSQSKKHAKFCHTPKWCLRMHHVTWKSKKKKKKNFEWCSEQEQEKSVTTERFIYLLTFSIIIIVQKKISKLPFVRNCYIKKTSIFLKKKSAVKW